MDFGHRTSSQQYFDGFHTRRARTCMPCATAHPASRPHQLVGQRYCGRGERHGSQYALAVVKDCHPRLHRRWRPGYRQCVNANRQKQAEHIKCSLSSSGSAVCVAVRWSMIGTMLKRTQKFACRMCTKTWNAGYEELQNTLQLPSLSNRRSFLKLCTIFKVIHGMCYFPPHVIFTRSTRTNFSRSFMLTQPFARTNSYFHSFVPDSVRQWNSLP